MALEEPEEEPVVDPLTTAVGGFVAGQLVKSSGNVLDRMLGPVADEIGQDLLRRYRNRNVQRVVNRADQLSDGGTVPLRVAAEVFEKAQWTDEEFIAEYLSGVLASSRTPDGKDDRGVTWTALVGRLSSDHLRLHYILSRAFRDLHLGNAGPAFLSDLLDQPMVFTAADIVTAMFGPHTPINDETQMRVLDGFYGLTAEGLAKIGPHGDGQKLNESRRTDVLYPEREIITASLTMRGAQLAVHAVGMGDQWPAILADPSEDPLNRLNIDPPLSAVEVLLENTLPPN